MLPNQARDARLLLAVAGLSLLAGCWLAGSRSSPDAQLVGLVGRLTALQSTSQVVASALVSAATILAAVLIPVVTVLSIRHGERRPPEPATMKPVLPEHDVTTQNQLPAGQPGALPSGSSPNALTARKVELGSTISAAPPQNPGETP